MQVPYDLNKIAPKVTQREEGIQYERSAASGWLSA
jgi:hypothetical protein